MRAILLGSSVLLLSLSALFGFLNNGKVRNLRAEVQTAEAARRSAELARVAQQKKTVKTTTAKPSAPAPEMENRIAKAEADLVQTQSEKSALQAKLEASEAEMTRMQQRLQELTAKAAETTDSSPPGTEDLQAQLEETRRQLDTAEREKNLLASRIEENSGSRPAARPARRRLARPAGVHGTVMAVNNPYNFVVLDLGARNGVEPHAEMLVLREGTLIAKIRVSSVEPATSIGDIMGSTLARGVKVQPGDSVIYAGTDS